MKLSNLTVENFRGSAFAAVRSFTKNDAETLLKLIQDSQASEVVFNDLQKVLTETTVAKEMAICIMVGIYLGKYVLD